MVGDDMLVVPGDEDVCKGISMVCEIWNDLCIGGTNNHV